MAVQFFSCIAIILMIKLQKKEKREIFMDDLLKVGIITNTHGLKGEVKVFPTTDDPRRFLDLDDIILDTGKELKTIKIEKVRFFKNMVILKFKGLDHINDVELYRQKDLYVTREQAVPLAENEYFIADLIDLQAVSDEGEELGVIVDVIQTGANDIYVIRKKGMSDLLIPAIKDCIKKIDLENERMEIHLLPGLREVNQK